MKKLLLFIIISGSTIPFFYSHAQHYYNSRFFESNLSWHVAGSVGGMNCITDLGGHNDNFHFLRDVNWINTKLSGHLLFKVLYHNKIALRFQMGIGKITAYDSVLNSDDIRNQGRLMRNLSFKTSIKEAILLCEIYPLHLFINAANFRVNPYVLAGIGIFHFNPKAKWQDKWVSLQPLHTEGQGFKSYPERKIYSLWQWNLPLGAGLGYPLSDGFQISLEFLYRKLFTDYLDDVSTSYISPEAFFANLDEPVARLAVQLANRQKNDNGRMVPDFKRGNPGNNDSYFSIHLKFLIKLGNDSALKP